MAWMGGAADCGTAPHARAQTPNINLALFALFGGLTITFALLAAGVNHPKANKVGARAWAAAAG